MEPTSLREVFKVSVKKAISGKIISFFFPSFSGVVAFFTFAKFYLGKNYFISVLYGLGVFVLVFGSKFIYHFIAQFLHYSHYKNKETKYGEAIIFLKDAFARVHALRKKQSFDDNDLLTTLIYLCDKLKELFDYHSPFKYSVSIKVAIDSSITMETPVRNLSRDSSNYQRDNDKYKSVKHSILENTAYREVLCKVLSRNNKKLYYINHDIPSDKKYENTSTHVYGNGILPYKSEIVVPIIPSINEDPNSYNIVGFLCVDCNGVNGFFEKYDTELIEGVADGIYDVILAKFVKREESPNAKKES